MFSQGTIYNCVCFSPAKILGLIYKRKLTFSLVEASAFSISVEVSPAESSIAFSTSAVDKLKENHSWITEMKWFQNYKKKERRKQ